MSQFENEAQEIMFGFLTEPDESGASAVEYGLLITGIAGIIVLAVFLFGGSVLDLFKHTCDTVGSATSTGSC